MISIVEEIIDSRKMFSVASSTIFELDAFQSLAEAADNFNLQRPNIVDESVIYIKEGRNMIIEGSTETFIPNDTSICHGREGSVQLLTGPNGSGKSVYLHQVAQICILAHIGSFVPAEAAKIGIIDKIMARIQSRESSFVDKSSFSLDCSQVAKILRYRSIFSLFILPFI